MLLSVFLQGKAGYSRGMIHATFFYHEKKSKHTRQQLESNSKIKFRLIELKKERADKNLLAVVQ